MSKILQPYKRRCSFRGEHFISSLINFIFKELPTHTNLSLIFKSEILFFLLTMLGEGTRFLTIKEVVCFQLLQFFFNLDSRFLPVLEAIKSVASMLS